jgi:hypothetical protein
MSKGIAKNVAYRRSPVKVADKEPFILGDAKIKFEPKKKETKKSPFPSRRK